MPGAVDVVDIRFGQPLDAVTSDQRHQALAMQYVEDGPWAAAGSDFLHRGLVELAPFDCELDPIDVGDALVTREPCQVAADAGAPIDHRAEDAEEAGLDLHQGCTLAGNARHARLARPSTMSVTNRLVWPDTLSS